VRYAIRNMKRKKDKPEIIYRTPSGRIVGYDQCGKRVNVTEEDIKNAVIKDAPWFDEGGENEVQQSKHRNNRRR